MLRKIPTLFYLLFLEVKRVAFGVKYFAEVDVTDNCNLRCRHCYHFHGKKNLRKREVPLSEWSERFRGLYKSGVRFILLVGGEPALRNDVLLEANKIFPFIFVITNGTIKIPKEFNHTLFVSIDGKEKTSDSLRGRGVFSRVMKNYKGDSRVIINMTITKDNYSELEEVVRIAKENMFTGVVCNVFTPTKKIHDGMYISKEERMPIINEFRRVKSIYPYLFLLNKSMIEWYANPDHRKSCHWGDNALHFDVSWKKRRCFTGLDCANCGCFAGSMQNPLRLISEPKNMTQFVKP